MTTGDRGFFVTIDGLGGAGKSTTTRLLKAELERQGCDVYATSQPSHAQLGSIARYNSDIYSGYALACLVAADRYQHLEKQIRFNLGQGKLVICDRYVPSSYVLQRMDNVPLPFIEEINAAADVPDLAVILTADPAVTAERIRQRGTHTRFESGLADSQREARLYDDAIPLLVRRGYPVWKIDTTELPPTKVAQAIAAEIARRGGVPQRDSLNA